MFVVLMRFSGYKCRDSHFLEGHRAWIKRGFDDGVFGLVGSLQSGEGGAILAYGISLHDLQLRVEEDPLVVASLVRVDILQITPSSANEQLEFLLERRRG